MDKPNTGNDVSEIPEHIKEYLKQNLKIKIKSRHGSSGRTQYFDIKLLLENEVISSEDFAVYPSK